MLHHISDKLIAINYPYSWDESLAAAEKINPKNLLDITVFLEDTILRTLPISSRERMKDAAFSKNKKDVYSAIHDYADSDNNVNIVKLQGGDAFVKSTGSAMEKLLRDVKECENNAGANSTSDLAAIVLVDRLLDLAIGQLVHDKSMDLEAAHTKWMDEQGKRNVASLDLSASLSQNRSLPKATTAAKTSATGLSSSVSQILSLRNGGTDVNKATPTSSSASVTAQIGAASRFAMGLVDFDAQYQDHVRKNKDKNFSSPTFLDLNDDWTKLALSEVALFGEERVIYDYRTNIAAALTKKKLSSSSSSNANATNEQKKMILLQNCARALRAIYSEDLSALQRRINVSLARLQELTATCATDAKLGRTGK